MVKTSAECGFYTFPWYSTIFISTEFIISTTSQSSPWFKVSKFRIIHPFQTLYILNSTPLSICKNNHHKNYSETSFLLIDEPKKVITVSEWVTCVSLWINHKQYSNYSHYHSVCLYVCIYPSKQYILSQKMSNKPQPTNTLKEKENCKSPKIGDFTNVG